MEASRAVQGRRFGVELLLGQLGTWVFSVWSMCKTLLGMALRSEDRESTYHNVTYFLIQNDLAEMLNVLPWVA